MDQPEQLVPEMDAQPVKGAGPIGFGRGDGDAHVLGDAVVGPAAQQALAHIEFAWRQLGALRRESAARIVGLSVRSIRHQGVYRKRAINLR